MADQEPLFTTEDQTDDFIVKGINDVSTNPTQVNSTTVDGKERLCVETPANQTVSPVPGANGIWSCSNLLLNGTGTKEMDVDGDPTAKEFYWQPSTGVYYINSIQFLIQDPGSSDVDDFGSISGGLSNGLLIEVKSNGVEYELANLKDNGDIVMCFIGNTGFSGDDSTGFLDSADTFFGQWNSPQGVWSVIDSSQGDFVKATVRDDIRNLSFLRMSAVRWRVP